MMADKELFPELEKGHYSDGHPLDDVHYLECKIILKPDRFTSKQGFIDFAKIVKHAAEKSDIDLSTGHLEGQRPEIREVVFLDTSDFRLYNHAFILRRRIRYEDGFPVGDPEIEFKAEMLPLKDKLGGMRILYSHNAEFGLSQAKLADRTAMATLLRFFPCLAPLKRSTADTVELVNQMIVEEVLFDLGKVDFGKGVVAKNDLALWRARGDHSALIGEYSFQAKFDRKDDLHPKVQRRVEEFFVAVQSHAHDWVSLGTTKTGIVYRLKGNPPQAHE